MMGTRILAVATHLAEERRTTAETERRIESASPGVRIPGGLIERLTGVREVREADAETMCSDLAVRAVRALEERRPGSLATADLLIFASAGQDLIEPATSHIVAAKLGFTGPVFDVKNACNSVLEAMNVARALIAAGQAEHILICSGERPTTAARWALEQESDFFRAFAGYTMGDAGAALLLGPDDGGEPGPVIVGYRTLSRSRHWDVGTLASGGTIDPDATHGRYFTMDGARLFEAFQAITPDKWAELEAGSGSNIDRCRYVLIYQVAIAHLDAVRHTLGATAEQLVVLLPEQGNIASCTILRQLEVAMSRGELQSGDEVMLVGLAGGISVAMMGLRW